MNFGVAVRLDTLTGNDRLGNYYLSIMFAHIMEELSTEIPATKEELIKQLPYSADSVYFDRSTDIMLDELTTKQQDTYLANLFNWVTMLLNTFDDTINELNYEVGYNVGYVTFR